jgi:hypothetical protein
VTFLPGGSWTGLGYGSPAPAPLPATWLQVLRDFLDEACVSAAMISSDWRTPSAPAPARAAAALAEVLLIELVTAEYEAWFGCQEAMSRLLQHSAPGEHAVHTCVDTGEGRLNPVRATVGP